MNPQLGTDLLVQNSPTFTNLIVVDGTWKKKDTTKHQVTDGGDGNVLNYAFWQAGAEFACDFVVKTGQTPPNAGDVITDTAAVAYIVLPGVTVSSFGGKPIKVAVQLATHVGFVPTVQSS